MESLLYLSKTSKALLNASSRVTHQMDYRRYRCAFHLYPRRRLPAQNNLRDNEEWGIPQQFVDTQFAAIRGHQLFDRQKSMKLHYPHNGRQLCNHVHYKRLGDTSAVSCQC
mmetsp:Transcript_7346/g.12200  ORF Transcript_7346/g.12200 Transcript_7346/m.12200 type:complete len:111 (-) Transcript_7346:2249-2581(-)